MNRKNFLSSVVGLGAMVPAFGFEEKKYTGLIPPYLNPGDIIGITSPAGYIAEMPVERQAAFKKLRAVIKKNLSPGFKEMMGYGMLGYAVPHSKYPDGYHCDPTQPLPFMGIASQKNFIAVMQS